jgi:hypothetical protein
MGIVRANLTFNGHLLSICTILLAYLDYQLMLRDIPMVSSTSAARGAVIAKVRARGTRRDRAAARNSCGRIIVRDSGRRRGVEGFGRWGGRGGTGKKELLFRVGFCWVT